MSRSAETLLVDRPLTGPDGTFSNIESIVRSLLPLLTRLTLLPYKAGKTLRLRLSEALLSTVDTDDSCVAVLILARSPV
jgi:hypothetical protein